MPRALSWCVPSPQPACLASLLFTAFSLLCNLLNQKGLVPLAINVARNVMCAWFLATAYTDIDSGCLKKSIPLIVSFNLAELYISFEYSTTPWDYARDLWHTRYQEDAASLTQCLFAVQVISAVAVVAACRSVVRPGVAVGHEEEVQAGARVERLV